MYKELGEDTVRTMDPDLPKGCPIPCGIMLNDKSGLNENWPDRVLLQGSDWVLVSRW